MGEAFQARLKRIERGSPMTSIQLPGQPWTGLHRQLVESSKAMRAVLRNPNLRRIELAWCGYMAGEWVHVVALLVFAYDAGGAKAVGLVTLIRMLPPAIAAPFASMQADKHSRRNVLLLVHTARSLGMVFAAGAVFLGAPPVTVYFLVALTALASVLVRPTQWALLPSLVETPEELIAANVAYAMIEGIGTLVGPAVGGALLAVADVSFLFVAAALFSLWSVVLTSRVDAGEPKRTSASGAGLVSREAFAGFRAVVSESQPRLLVALFGAQTLVRGALNVLLVVLAIDLLQMSDSGVGWLNAAVGAGGLTGSVGTLSLAGHHRLGSSFGRGLVLWGGPLLLLGVWPEPTVALVLLALVGGGNALVDVAGLTLLQRTVADHVLARVMGVLEFLAMATIGLGGLVAPLAISQFGVRGTLVVAGALLPLLVLFSWRSLRRIDARTVEARQQVTLLRQIPMFAPLSSLMLEQLASRLRRVTFERGSQVFHQGDAGNSFYVIAEGNVEIIIDGFSARILGAGDYFGEIALLRDVQRTGTAEARSDVTLFALERDEFVPAVTGHPTSAEEADSVVGARLAHLAPRIA